ncbi:MAG: sialate O-acetylesterase [Bosea sp. (in: a-proteobacteria)]
MPVRAHPLISVVPGNIGLEFGVPKVRRARRGANIYIPKMQVVAIGGQSNALGMQIAANVGLTAVDEIKCTYKHSKLVNPPVHITEGRTSTKPRGLLLDSITFPVGSCGIELALAHYLRANSSLRWELCSNAIDGSGLTAHWLNPAWPTGGPAYLTQHLDFIQSVIDGCDGELAGYIWAQGEYDAASTDNVLYASALASLRAALRARFGTGFKFIVHRLSSRFGGNSSGIIRAAQEGLQQGNPDVWITYGDQYTMRDFAHYSDEAYELLAEQVGAILLADEKPACRWWGAGVPSFKSAAGTLTPTTPGYGRIGVVAIAGIGNTAYSPGAGWNFIASVHDNSVLTSARLDLYWCVLAEGQTVNVADLPADDAGAAVVFAVEGVDLINPIDVFSTAFASTATTAVSVPSATATGPGYAFTIVGHEIDSNNYQASGWSAGLVEHINTGTTLGSGAGFVGAGKPIEAAGATGATTTTMATATTWAGAQIVFRRAAA